jgi:hypothetical protein
MSGNQMTDRPIGHSRKKDRKAQYIHKAAPITAASSLHESSRRNTNIIRPARKNVIAARNVRLFAIGSSIEKRKNGSYGVGCADAARMSPQNRNGFHSGHSRWAYA